jgi:hypothetical protein
VLKVLLDLQVPQVLRVPKVEEVPQVLVVPQVVEVLRVHKVLREVKVQQVIQVLLVLQVVLVQQGLKELLGQQGDKELKVGLELVPALKVLLEDKVLKVPMVYRHKVRKELKV